MARRRFIISVLVLAAILTTAGNAYATAYSAAEYLNDIPYYAENGEYRMTGEQAEQLAGVLSARLEGLEGSRSAYAGLVDPGTGAPSMYYIEGTAAELRESEYGLGLEGRMDDSAGFTAAGWQFVDGEIREFYPGIYFGDHMLYKNSYAGGRLENVAAAPIVDGVVDVDPETGGEIIGTAAVAWYEVYLGLDGSGAVYREYTGEFGEYAHWLRDASRPFELGVWGGEFRGLGPAEDVLSALRGYAQEYGKEPEAIFVDVPIGHWAEGAVRFVYERGLMQPTGNNTFEPSVKTSRGMAMTVMARLAGVDTYSVQPWDKAGVDWAVENGLTTNTNSAEVISRQELIGMLWAVAGRPEAELMAVGEFDDLDLALPEYRQALCWAVEIGIIRGSGTGLLNPGGETTRAELAAFLQRAFDAGVFS